MSSLRFMKWDIAWLLRAILAPVASKKNGFAGWMGPCRMAERGVRVSHRDQVTAPEGQVQAGLVAQMFDPADETLLARPLFDLFGAQADMGGAAGALPNRSAGRMLIRGWPSRLAAVRLTGFS